MSYARHCSSRLSVGHRSLLALLFQHLPAPVAVDQSPLGAWSVSMHGMAAVLYRFSITGKKVQVWYADDVSDDSVYVSLRCPACARVHLVNRKGRILMSHPTS
jgi:hypothetical protein